MKLDAEQLRVSEPSEKDLGKIKRRQIYIICDNILDAYNIGSIFRLADAVAAAKIYLCGQTQTPPYHRIAKAAVGTEKWVPWQHSSTAVEAISNIKYQISRQRPTSTSQRRGERGSPLAANIKFIAVEQSKKAIDYRKTDLSEPVAFIVGHETNGVSKEALKIADQVVEIPMYGVNRSLNVMVSLAVVLFKAIEKLR